MLWIALLLTYQTPQGSNAADSRAATERSIAAQNAAIDRQRGGASSNSRGAPSGLALQRDSVRRQAAALQPGIKPLESSFFTVPWPLPEASNAQDVCQPPPRAQLNYLIDAAAHKAGLRPELVREVVRQESGFDPCAESPAGAQGLMQIMPSVQNQFQVSDAFNLAQNLSAGTQLLRSLLDRYDGDIVSALAAYNAGPRRVDAARGVPTIAETRKYVSDIMGRLPP